MLPLLLPPALVIAAPASGSGKTVLTLALLRALRRAGMRIGACKIGPDYIDPRFHEAACGRPCLSLDPWAMRPESLVAAAAQAGLGADRLLVEGVMGLFDGAADGTAAGSGSTADLAARFGWPVVLVVDAARQSQSVAALVQGFLRFRSDTNICGVILNRVGSPRHARLLRRALEPVGVPVLGLVPNDPGLHLPDRHLGLVQAAEHPALEAFLDHAAAVVADHVDLTVFANLFAARDAPGQRPRRPPPPGQRIALAWDAAFAFVYPHLASGWQADGAEILPFSPLADEAPDRRSDAVWLPGGYPELHAQLLGNNTIFLNGLRGISKKGIPIHGECGGYMVLGHALEDADGQSHAMAGLLPLVTSFRTRRRQLGYRRAELRADGVLGAAGTALRGHEFHYATVSAEGGPGAAPLARLFDAAGEDLGPAGLVRGRVSGSFFHLIDCEDAPAR